MINLDLRHSLWSSWGLPFLGLIIIEHHWGLGGGNWVFARREHRANQLTIKKKKKLVNDLICPATLISKSIFSLHDQCKFQVITILRIKELTNIQQTLQHYLPEMPTPKVWKVGDFLGLELLLCWLLKCSHPASLHIISPMLPYIIL